MTSSRRAVKEYINHSFNYINIKKKMAGEKKQQEKAVALV